MSNWLNRAVELLIEAEVSLDAGLSEREIDRIERRFQFRFCGEHRTLLRAVLPVGPRWPSWREGPDDALESSLNWPVDGVLFDVEHNGFWARSWGLRPADTDHAVDLARTALAAVPRLVPIHGHRYLPAAAGPSPAPVLSVHQTDVIYYGTDVVDYLGHEFFRHRYGAPSGLRAYIPFWSDLTDSDGSDL